MLRTLPALALFLGFTGPAAAQEPKKDEPAGKTVKLRWFGQSFFQLETANRIRIVFDPHAIPNFGRGCTGRLRAHQPSTQRPQPGRCALESKVKEGDIYRGVVEPKPGKQEWKTVDEKRGQIHFRNLGTFHDATNGTQRGKNSIWIVEADGLVFCHLGDLGHELTDVQVKAIGKVDVLMVPIGGIYTLNGEQAKKVVKRIKPRLYVLPMHYGVPDYDDLLGPEEFLEGQKNVKKMLNTNELDIPLDLKADAPTVVLLGWEKRKVEPKKEEPKKK